jgi:hypothetical protein
LPDSAGRSRTSGALAPLLARRLDLSRLPSAEDADPRSSRLPSADLRSPGRRLQLAYRMTH